MAKRSVKKARQRTPAAPSPSAPSTRRPFWLGVLVAAAVLIPLGIVGVVIASGSEEQSPEAAEEAAVRDEVESEAARLREQTQVRDREQVQELTDRMRGTAEALGPVLDGLARTLPPGEERTGPLESAGAVGDWRGTVGEEDEFFADTVSGETGTNVARGGFAAALDTLGEAIESYRLAVAQPSARGPLLEQARRQRDLAVRTWSVAATQLDAINIATGYGHQHVYLGGTEAAGGFGADPAPEGSGAEGGE
jgi:hypothetical protein